MDEPLLKRWTVRSDRPDINELSSKCSGRHQHSSIQFRGALAKQTDTYTPELCSKALRFLKTEPRQKVPTIDANTADALPADIDGTLQEPMSAEALNRAIAHLHSSMGHPSPSAMARAVRLISGSEEAIKACLQYRCPVCERLREPQPTSKSKISPYTEFGQCVAVDLFTLLDIAGKAKTFINAVDMASVYQMVGAVDSKHPRIVFARFCEVWLSWAGCPEAVMTDMGG